MYRYLIPVHFILRWRWERPSNISNLRQQTCSTETRGDSPASCGAKPPHEWRVWWGGAKPPRGWVGLAGWSGVCIGLLINVNLSLIKIRFRSISLEVCLRCFFIWIRYIVLQCVAHSVGVHKRNVVKQPAYFIPPLIWRIHVTRDTDLRFAYWLCSDM